MGVSGQHHAPAAFLPPGKGPPVPIVQEAGCATEPVWTQRLQEKYFASAGNRTPVVQPVVRHYTAWANPAPLNYYIYISLTLATSFCTLRSNAMFVVCKAILGTETDCVARLFTALPAVMCSATLSKLLSQISMLIICKQTTFFWKSMPLSPW
jgi:hypothetical protein